MVVAKAVPLAHGHGGSQEPFNMAACIFPTTQKRCVNGTNHMRNGSSQISSIFYTKYVNFLSALITLENCFETIHCIEDGHVTSVNVPSLIR